MATVISVSETAAATVISVGETAAATVTRVWVRYLRLLLSECG